MLFFPKLKSIITDVSMKSKLAVINENVKCEIKCTACCHRYISITIAEAIVIVQYLKQINKIDRVLKIANEQKEMSTSIKPIIWYKLEIPCPVLNENNECDAYYVRPPVCSTHFVKSPPEACKPSSTSYKMFERVNLSSILTKYAEDFDKTVKNYNNMTIGLPMPIALIIAEKTSIKFDGDFNENISLVRKIK